jgi:thiol:disulfide interchange protein DsbD
MKTAFRLVALTSMAVLMTAAAARAQLPINPERVMAFSEIKLDKLLSAGQTSTLTVGAEVANGWHVNSNKPLDPDFIPTRLTVSVPDGVTVGAVIYPPAEQLALGFAADEKLSVFSGALQFTVPLSAAASFKPTSEAIAGVTLDYQPCNNNICLRPASIHAAVTLAEAERDPAPVLAGSTGAGSPDDESVAARIFSHGSVLGFLFVLLAGIALNLTPCVYPLIAVTIAYFGNQAGTTRSVITLALTYVLGIALMFSSVGVAVAMSGGLFGAALQNRYVLSAIALMLLALAASSFGLFSLQPPQWLMNRAGVARPGYLGALLMGLSMGVVAAPCIGPVVLGLLLLVERSESPLFGFALFFTLAVGLGLPYVALALAAGSIRRLPRSGEWLGWIEQLFGFVLTGLALYFIDPLVPNHLILRLLPFYAAAVGIFLGFVTAAGRNWRPFWISRIGLGALSAGAFVYLMIPGHPITKLEFRPYDATLLASARSAHQPVVIDFAASWCIPCREMENTTFVDPQVRSAASRFITMRADLTAQDGVTDALTKQFGIRGVPTVVFIDSQGAIRKRVAGFINPQDFLDNLRQID